MALRRNKKGNVPMEVIATFVVFIMFAIIGMLTLLFMGSFNDKLQETVGVNDYTKQKSQDYNNLTRSLLDGAFIFYLTILWVGTLVTSYYLDSNPIFFAIFVILGILTFFIMIPIANVVMALDVGTFATYFDYLPMTMFIINNMAIFIVIYLVTIGFALYSKNQSGGGYYG